MRVTSGRLSRRLALLPVSPPLAPGTPEPPRAHLRPRSDLAMLMRVEHVHLARLTLKLRQSHGSTPAGNPGGRCRRRREASAPVVAPRGHVPLAPSSLGHGHGPQTSHTSTWMSCGVPAGRTPGRGSSWLARTGRATSVRPRPRGARGQGRGGPHGSTRRAGHFPGMAKPPPLESSMSSAPARATTPPLSLQRPRRRPAGRSGTRSGRMARPGSHGYLMSRYR